MDLEQIIPAFYLITILVLILPSFIKSSYKTKPFIKNLLIWSIIVVSVVIVSSKILK